MFRLSENPLYKRLAARVGGLSMTAIFSGLLLVEFALSTLITVTSRGYGGFAYALTSSFGVLSIALLVMIFLMPAVVGQFAATFAARDARTDEFRLLRITTLTPRQVVEAYMGAAFRRYQGYLALTGCALPAVLLLIWQVITPVAWIFGPGLTQHMVWSGFTIATLEMSFPAVALGAALGLRWRNPELAGAVTAGSFISLSIGAIIVVARWVEPRVPPIVPIMAVLIWMAIPIPAGLGIMRIAVRSFERHHPG